MRRVLERLLNLLAFLLTVERPVSADEIRLTVAGYDQESDEAFRRMFERDKDLLRRLGIPLRRQPTDAWEVEFGYVVPPNEYEMPDPGLTDDERVALLLAAQIVQLGGQPSGPEAVLKLGGAPLAGGGEPLAADLGADGETLAVAFEATVGLQRLSFGYRDRRRTVDPYGLVHQRGHWYLIAAEGGERRAYRIDRAEDLEAVGKPGSFERPQHFSARDALPKAPWEAGPADLVAVALFDAEVAWWAKRQLPDQEEVEERADGSLRARLRVANPDAFVGWILGFGAAAEILEPASLRSALLDRVRGVG